MAEREGPRRASELGHQDAARGNGHERPPGSPESTAELRDVNERLLISGLREQELAATLEAERARLAVILAGIGDAVLVVDRTGMPVRTNAAYARMFGGAEARLAAEDTAGQSLPPMETPQARAARGETFSLEFALTASDGSRRWYEANGQPLQDDEAAHAVVVIRDITMTRGHRLLQDEFLALASHELRTPLTSIQGYLDLLLRVVQPAGGDERITRYATRAREETQRLGALVRDLTDVSRLQSGKLTLTWGVVDLATLAARVVEVARDLPPGHSIRLEPPAGSLRVRGDAERLEQVLFNLLTNALTYAPGEAPIDVRLWREGGEIALAVQDYGRGIAADQLPHLFARFYQVTLRERRSRGGLGLGLFICHELVTAHGGHIEVASTEGEGTTFTVWLPELDTAVARPA